MVFLSQNEWLSFLLCDSPAEGGGGGVAVTGPSQRGGALESLWLDPLRHPMGAPRSSGDRPVVSEGRRSGTGTAMSS